MALPRRGVVPPTSLEDLSCRSVVAGCRCDEADAAVEVLVVVPGDEIRDPRSGGLKALERLSRIGRPVVRMDRKVRRDHALQGAGALQETAGELAVLRCFDLEAMILRLQTSRNRYRYR